MIVIIVVEYISPEKVEQAISQSPLVSQAFVHGEATESKLVCVIVPDVEAVVQWLQARHRGDSQQSQPQALQLRDLPAVGHWLANHPTELADFKASLLNQLQSLCHSYGLRGYEVVHKLHIEGEEGWTADNGLATPTMNIKRPALRLRYGAAIAAMYEELRRDDRDGGGDGEEGNGTRRRKQTLRSKL